MPTTPHRSGRHAAPTDQERAEATALVTQLRALICPEMPDSIPLAKLERMLELPRQSLQRCVVARGEARRRMSPAVRVAVEGEIARRAPVKGRAKKDRETSPVG